MRKYRNVAGLCSAVDKSDVVNTTGLMTNVHELVSPEGVRWLTAGPSCSGVDAVERSISPSSAPLVVRTSTGSLPSLAATCSRGRALSHSIRRINVRSMAPVPSVHHPHPHALPSTDCCTDSNRRVPNVCATADGASGRRTGRGRTCKTRGRKCRRRYAKVEGGEAEDGGYDRSPDLAPVAREPADGSRNIYRSKCIVVRRLVAPQQMHDGHGHGMVIVSMTTKNRPAIKVDSSISGRTAAAAAAGGRRVGDLWHQSFCGSRLRGVTCCWNPQDINVCPPDGASDRRFDTVRVQAECRVAVHSKSFRDSKRSEN